MKYLILLAVVACAYAKPGFVYNSLPYAAVQYKAVAAPAAPVVAAAPAPVVYSAPAVVAPAFTKTQYHAQDELGQASYGYAHPGQAHAASRDAFGNVIGSYSYIDPNNREVRVNYIADAAGFRVTSNALPEGPAVPAAPALVAPVPVQDTPEVAEARAAHEKAIEEAQARNAAADAADAAEQPAEEAKSRRKRGLAYTYPALAAPAHVAYAAPAPVAYAAPAHLLREATLTKVVNNPGHAVSYRVD